MCWIMPLKTEIRFMNTNYEKKELQKRDNKTHRHKNRHCCLVKLTTVSLIGSSKVLKSGSPKVWPLPWLGIDISPSTP